MSENWPLHPTPKVDELLSDWILRIASSYGITYLVFCQRVLKLNHDEIIQINEKPSEKALVVLSKGTGQPIDWLREMTVIGRRRRAMEAFQERQRRLKEIRELFEKINNRSSEKKSASERP